MSKAKSRKEPYPFVQPDLKDWPLYKLTKDKEAFLKEVIEYSIDKINANNEDVSDEIAKAIYLERIRIKEEPWRVDPRDEKKFWSSIRKGLVNDLRDEEAEEDTEEKEDNNDELLHRIISRYANEIVGSFNIKTYWFARRFLTMGFTRLLNATQAKNILKFGDMRYRLQERVVPTGEIDHIRKLSEKGTLVIVPTHFSNLDSILIGLTIDFMGLPALSYGAGLNLFNTGILAYFMNRLGAYRVDRRKKNSIYIETLKSYSNLSIQRGTHSLFFPGGTRSRSGMIEKKLKLGLLGTVIEAQKEQILKGEDHKIFVVPMVLNYHFVLEAKSLIEQHLKRVGKEQYIVAGDEFQSYFKILKFILGFFDSSSEIVVQMGKPMDVLGNFVNEEGESIGKHGNILDIKDYFVSSGTPKYDAQRDREYTRLLAEKLVERYHAENIVLSSHIITFTAFNILKQQYPNLDLYGILRLSPKKFKVAKADFLIVLKRLIDKLKELNEKERLILPEENQDAETVLEMGLSNLGIYHDKRTLKLAKGGEYLISQSLRLLYYYHNRLIGYGLERRVDWSLQEDI